MEASFEQLKVLHFINGLHAGGAQAMLYKLLSRIDRNRYRPHVVSLIDGGEISGQIAKLGVPVQSLGMRRGIPDLRALARATHILRAVRPHIVQTWLPHADLVGGLAGALARVPIAWNIRHSVLDAKDTPVTTRVTERACAVLSRWLPRVVVCCSNASQHAAARLGYDLSKLLVIPNGFDLGAFRPDMSARIGVRRDLGLSEDTILVGLVARFDPLKDHQAFIRAAGRVHASRANVHFVMCGFGVDSQNPALACGIDAAGIAQVVHLLGPRRDMPRIQAALDVACLSSIGEGFPNAVGEAMASAVPCVVTDVGDAAEIVGDTGLVVPAQRPSELAAALLKLIDLDPLHRIQIGQRARERIESRYELGAITRRYEDLYEGMRIARAA